MTSHAANQKFSTKDINSDLLNFIIDASSDAIYVFDDQRNIVFVNHTASRQTGYDMDELTSMNIQDLDLEHQSLTSKEYAEVAQTNTKRVFRTVHRCKDGSSFPVEISSTAHMFNGSVYVYSFARDISEQVAVLKELEAGEERFRVIADTSPVALIISRINDGRVLYANKLSSSLFGYSREELNVTNILDLLNQGGVDQDIFPDLFTDDQIINRELKLSRGDDSFVWVSINAKAFNLQGEEVLCCAFLDVTEARELSIQLSYQATYDDLTGLLNRREFEDRLQEVIDIAETRKSQNVLCYLDLDQFKVINDTCGHMAGDELLRQISFILDDCVRKDDVIARLGGDEFAIMLENCSIENAEIVADKVRSTIQDLRFSWSESTFNVSVSMGLVPIGTEGESITNVMRRADTACYAAKDAGRNRIHIIQFDDEELQQRQGEMQWIAKLNDAMTDGGLELWLQSIVSTASPETDSGHFEVLLRMRGKENEIISPGTFLPAAERYDLAPRVDRWVVQEAFKWVARKLAEGEVVTCCSINLSGQSLSGNNFLEEITGWFQSSGIPPNIICFEITETAAISNMAHATQFMKSLKSLGCMFALDDFGSGLSSFAYLKTLPVDFVKIDGFFVKDVITDPVDLAMVKSINDMAHAMGKLTVAEFVENEEILQVMIEIAAMITI